MFSLHEVLANWQWQLHLTVTYQDLVCHFVKETLSLNIIISLILLLYVCHHRSRVMGRNFGFRDWRKYLNYHHEFDKTHTVDRTVTHSVFLTTKSTLLELSSYIRMTLFEQHYVAYMHRQPASIIRVIKCEHQRSYLLQCLDVQVKVLFP